MPLLLFLYSPIRSSIPLGCRHPTPTSQICYKRESCKHPLNRQWLSWTRNWSHVTRTSEMESVEGVYFGTTIPTMPQAKRILEEVGEKTHTTQRVSHFCTGPGTGCWTQVAYIPGGPHFFPVPEMSLSLPESSLAPMPSDQGAAFGPCPSPTGSLSQKRDRRCSAGLTTGKHSSISLTTSQVQYQCQHRH